LWRSSGGGRGKVRVCGDIETGWVYDFFNKDGIKEIYISWYELRGNV
jgi:hypothetical protein